MGLIDALAKLIGSDKRCGGLFLALCTDEELNEIREKARQEMCSGSEEAHYTLERIDNAINARRSRSGLNENGSTYHTEHG